MGAASTWCTCDVLSEQRDRARVGCELSGDQIEQRGLAGPIGTDDETPLAGLDRKVDALGDTKAAERFRQSGDGQRRHGGAPAAGLRAGRRSRQRRRAKPQIRTAPGTNPSGMTELTPTQ